MIRKRIVALIVTGFICMTAITGLAGCSRKPPSETTAPVAETAANEKSEQIAGFTLISQERSSILNAEVLTFIHEKSGAELVCIKNDDPELAFGVFYNTPVVDETDTNHIFEHAILSASAKYPSRDLFFDMLNKSYNTYTNALTYNTFTAYPVASKSQDQLIKMADVYLSCMVQPDIITNENLYKREALRYQLYSKEEPITMTGTVFSEDFGSLTDIYSESTRNLARALYPGFICFQWCRISPL